MKELIEISNYLLLNYWWIILPVCAIVAIFLTFIQMKLEKKYEESNKENTKEDK